MFQCRCPFLIALALCLLSGLVPLTGALGQTTSTGSNKLKLDAALLMTPEFCATKMQRGGGAFARKETYEVGKSACTELEPALRTVFSSLVPVATESSSTAAQLLLVPRFVNIDATAQGFHGHTHLLIVLEWTAKDKSGRTVWIETVQGSAMNRIKANVEKDVGVLVEEAVKDAVGQSASKISSSPDLRKLADGNALSNNK